MTLQLDKRTRLSVQRASRRSTGLRVRKRKTAHPVDQNPPDAPSERPHDNVLNHSHSIVAGGLGVTSYTTRFTPATSPTMRTLMRSITS